MAMQSKPQKFRARSGFTLVEILVVVVILGIVGAIVGAQMGRRDDLRATAAARVLLADLQYAQNRAISRRTPHYVVVGGGSANLVIRTLDGTTWSDVLHPIDGGALGMVFGSDGTGGGKDVDLSSFGFEGKAILGFDGTGEPFTCAADGSGRTALGTPATFVLQCGDFTQTIVVQPITGEVSLQ